MNDSFPAPASLHLELVWAAQHDVGPKWTHFAPAVGAASLWHIERGEVSVESDGEVQRASAGDWVWRPGSGARHMTVGAVGARWKTVGGVALCGSLNWFAPPRSLIFRPLAAEKRGTMLMVLLAEGVSSGALRLELDGLARALMGWLWKASGQSLPIALPSWLAQALARIEGEPGVSVAELAHQAHFSPAQFRRLWHRHLGQSPQQTLARRRLEKARALLEDPALSVAAIAARTGFAGSAQLGRAFRTAYGSPPLEWRRATRERL